MVAMKLAVNADNFRTVKAVLEKGGATGGAQLGDAKLDALARELNAQVPGAQLGRADVRALVADWAALSARLEGAVATHEARQAAAKSSVGATLDQGARRAASSSYANPTGPMATRLASAAGNAGKASSTQQAQGRSFGEALVAGAKKAVLVAAIAGTLLGTGFSGVAHAQTSPAAGNTAAVTMTTSVRQEARVQTISRDNVVQDMQRTWRAGTQLYVAGDQDALTPQQQRQLAEALQAHPNWTVIVVESGSNSESNVRWADQQRDALSDAMQRTGFNQIKDGNEQNGAWLFWDAGARRVAFFASAQHDRFGLTEQQFENGGPLFAPFKEAMQRGNDGVAAVMSSIDNIERQVDQAKANEAAAAQARVTDARGAITDARAQIDGLASQAATFRTQHPGSAIGNPDLAQLRASLDAAQDKLDRGDATGAKQAAQQVRAQADGQMQLITQFAGAGAKLDAASSRLDGLAGNEFAEHGASQIAQARKDIETARTSLAAGSTRYLQDLRTAESSTTAAVDEVEGAEQSAAAMQRAMMLAAAALLLAMMAAGAIANRRRKGAKTEAEGLLDKKTEQLQLQAQGLVELMKRIENEVARNPAAAKARFEGETQAMALQLLKDAGDLMVMGGNSELFIKAATEEIKGNKVVNLFSSRNYKDGIDLLTNRPVPMDPSLGLEAAMGGKGREWRDDLAAVVKDFTQFQASFDDVVRAFAGKQATVLSTMDTIVHDKTKGQDILNATSAEAKQARGLAENALNAGAADGLFTAPSAKAAIAAGEAAIDKANQRVLKDPVGAMKGDGAEGRRAVGESTALLQLLADVRKPGSLLAKADAGKKALAAAQMPTQWIDDAVKALSDRAEKTARKAATSTVAADVDKLRADVVDLGARVDAAVQLDGLRRGDSRKQIDSSQALVDTTRKSLGKDLAIDADKVLREPGLDPSARIANAETRIADARKALETGDVVAARTALGDVQSLTKEADKIVADTKAAHAAYPQTLKDRKATSADVGAKMPRHETAIDMIVRDFVPAALEQAAKRGTLKDNVDVARQALRSAEQSTADAETLFAKGAILGAATKLADADASHRTSYAEYAEIVEGRTTLDALVASNQKKLTELEGEADHLAEKAANSVVRQPARHALQDAEGEIDAAKKILNARPNDPFAIQKYVDGAASSLGDVDRLIRADHAAHDSAQSSIRSASSDVSRADSWSGRHVRGVDGDGGSSELSQAKSLMSSQKYEDAERKADSASREARNAISNAESKDASIQRRIEEEERAERRRQEEAAERARQSSSSSSSSYSGGSGAGSSSY